ncbi:hypothetical protein ACFFX0_18650 [Citricoccus parietis]|uniref:Uncharacterized protein n=1 Tax=Citricoccus parietis TaxID=592307 RepID=A0ABV5G2E7_9MICC
MPASSAPACWPSTTPCPRSGSMPWSTGSRHRPPADSMGHDVQPPSRSPA